MQHYTKPIFVLLDCIDNIPSDYCREDCSYWLRHGGCDAHFPKYCDLPGKVKEYCRKSCNTCTGTVMIEFLEWYVNQLYFYVFHIRVALIFNSKITYLDHHATSVATQKTMTMAAALTLVIQSNVVPFIMRLILENKITMQWVIESFWHHFVET